MTSLAGRRVAFLVANEGIEQVELERPWEAVRSAGGEAHLIAPEPGTAQAFDHLDKADTFPVETSWPSLRTDIRNARGTWVDEEVHVDRGLVTSRRPDDLAAFCDKLVDEVAEGRHAELAAAARS